MIELALLGDPVAHSLSPALHQAWLQEAGLQGRYRLVQVPAVEVREDPEALRRRLAPFQGVNLTVPLKELGARCADRLAPDAARTGACNTLVRTDAGWLGDNTDLEGFRRAVLDAGGRLDGVAVVLGAGGAARAVVGALLPSARRVVVLNRTPGRARALGGESGSLVDFEAVCSEADLVVVAVSGPGNEAIRSLSLDRLPVDALWMDLNYWCDDPPHREALQARGNPFDDGLAMLLHQGALAFERFTGVRPSLEVGRRAFKHRSGLGYDSAGG